MQGVEPSCLKLAEDPNCETSTAYKQQTLSGGQTGDDSCFRPLLPSEAVALQGEDAGEEAGAGESGIRPRGGGHGEARGDELIVKRTGISKRMLFFSRKETGRDEDA